MNRGKAAFHLSRLIWWKPLKFSTFRPYFASPGVTWGPTWSTKGLAKSRSRGSKGKTKPSISPSKPHLAWILIFWWNTGCYSVTSWGFAESPVGVSYLALTMTSLRSGRLTIVYGYWLILDWRGWLATSVLGGWLVLAWEVEYCMGKLASLRLGRLTCVWRNWLVLDWGGWQVLDQEGWLVLHCTMCILASMFTFQPNKLRHILKVASW